MGTATGRMAEDRNDADDDDAEMNNFTPSAKNSASYRARGKVEGNAYRSVSDFHAAREESRNAHEVVVMMNSGVLVRLL